MYVTKVLWHSGTMKVPSQIELKTALERELNPRERIIWSAKPDPELLGKTGRAIYFFAIPWTLFAIFWMTMAGFGVWSSGKIGIHSLFPLFGLPFVGVGVWMLKMPSSIRKKAHFILYAITDERAVIFELYKGSKLRSFGPEKIRNREKIENADGSGNIIFDTEYGRDSDGDRTQSKIGFIGFRGVRDAEIALRNLVESKALK